jgi:pimeloyl-ACP methyl ester carboxylesterase
LTATNVCRKTADLAGVEIFYLDTETSGPAILCLHGRWGRAETWIDFIRHFGNKYHIIAPDQRGHGLSGRPESTYSADEMSEDMARLADHLGLDELIAVGHSMGGRIGAYLAARHPTLVTGLAILDKSTSVHETSNGAPDKDPLTKDWPLPFTCLADAQEFLKEWTDSSLAYQYFMNSLAETQDGYIMRFSSHAMASSATTDSNSRARTRENSPRPEPTSNAVLRFFGNRSARNEW